METLLCTTNLGATCMHAAQWVTRWCCYHSNRNQNARISHGSLDKQKDKYGSRGPYPGAVPPKPRGCWLLFQFSNSCFTDSIRDSHSFLAAV